MKKREMRSVLDALKCVKWNKIEDPGLRDALVRIHVKLLKLFREYQSDFEDEKTAFLGTYKNDKEYVDQLEERLRTEKDETQRAQILEKIKAKKDYLDAVEKFNRNAERLWNEEVELELIDLDKFVEEYQKQDYEFGVVEALFPLFKS